MWPFAGTAAQAQAHAQDNAERARRAEWLADQIEKHDHLRDRAVPAARAAMGQIAESE